MPKFVSIRPAYKILTSNYSSRTLLFFASYADFFSKKEELNLSSFDFGYIYRSSFDIRILIFQSIGFREIHVKCSSKNRTLRWRIHANDLEKLCIFVL